MLSLLFSLIWIKSKIRQRWSIPLTQQGTQQLGYIIRSPFSGWRANGLSSSDFSKYSGLQTVQHLPSASAPWLRRLLTPPQPSVTTMLSHDLMYSPQIGLLLALTPASCDYNQAWLAGDNMISLVYFLAALASANVCLLEMQCHAYYGLQ